MLRFALTEQNPAREKHAMLMVLPLMEQKMVPQCFAKWRISDRIIFANFFSPSSLTGQAGVLTQPFRCFVAT